MGKAIVRRMERLERAVNRSDSDLFHEQVSFLQRMDIIQRQLLSEWIDLKSLFPKNDALERLQEYSDHGTDVVVSSQKARREIWQCKYRLEELDQVNDLTDSIPEDTMTELNSLEYLPASEVYLEDFAKTERNGMETLLRGLHLHG